MGGLRCALAVLAAWILQGTLLGQIPLFGAVPALLPPLLLLMGMTRGGKTGAYCGLLGGILHWLSGASPWNVAFYTLLGGLSGQVFHNPTGFWGKWLRCLPLLLLLAALQTLLYGCPDRWLPALTLAGTECLLSLALYPLAALLWRAANWNRRRP